MHELPWGTAIRICIVVPQFASGNEHQLVGGRRHGRLRIVTSPKVASYRAHVAAVARQGVSRMRAKDPAFAELQIPVDGKATQLRLDLYFGFHTDEDGSHRRLKLADGDNLRKTTQDALQGVLYDNDRYVVEGYTAIGYAPPQAEGDVVWITMSRAGYRQAGELAALHMADHFAVIPPWRAADQNPVAVIAPNRGLILPRPGQN